MYQYCEVYSLVRLPICSFSLTLFNKMDCFETSKFTNEYKLCLFSYHNKYSLHCLSVVTCYRFTSFQGISILLIVMTVGQLSYGEIFTDKVTKNEFNKPKKSVIINIYV